MGPLAPMVDRKWLSALHVWSTRKNMIQRPVGSFSREENPLQHHIGCPACYRYVPINGFVLHCLLLVPFSFFSLAPRTAKFTAVFLSYSCIYQCSWPAWKVTILRGKGCSDHRCECAKISLSASSALDTPWRQKLFYRLMIWENLLNNFKLALWQCFVFYLIDLIVFVHKRWWLRQWISCRTRHAFMLSFSLCWIWPHSVQNCALLKMIWKGCCVVWLWLCVFKSEQGAFSDIRSNSFNFWIFFLLSYKTNGFVLCTSPVKWRN